VENGRAELRWGIEQRLEFIEFRLFWEGHVNRSDLMEQFGLSVNQASADLNRYIGFAPDNMVYDRSARTYVRGALDTREPSFGQNAIQFTIKSLLERAEAPA